MGAPISLNDNYYTIDHTWAKGGGYPFEFWLFSPLGFEALKLHKGKLYLMGVQKHVQSVPHLLQDGLRVYDYWAAYHFFKC